MPISSEGIALSVRGLSKAYSLVHKSERPGSLRSALRGKRSQTTRETFWALKDVSFDVGKGEVVGIVGRNGAGKSTLLKILSRITEPTHGRVELFGRVGSLLEVGTGFHPELTGRENIFLNGAILGMRRREIERQFDAIVEFAGVEKFLDTPVKRYSSGMYVRLAFAVAAHLQPEILIVDEVLAVGDAAFQKRCLGKMGEVSRAGRTILFVSHNMAAVRSLCTRGLLMKNGELVLSSDTETVVKSYLSEDQAADALVIWNEEDAPRSPEICFSKAYILNDRGEAAASHDCRKGFTIVVEYDVLVPLSNLRVGFHMQNADGITICGSNDPDAWPDSVRLPGSYVSRCRVPGYTLNAGLYSVYFGADVPPHSILAITPYCLTFTVEDMEGHGPMKEELPGVLRPNLNWQVQRVKEK